MAFISFASLGSEGAGPQAESWLSVSASDASPTATSSKTAPVILRRSDVISNRPTLGSSGNYCRAAPIRPTICDERQLCGVESRLERMDADTGWRPPGVPVVPTASPGTHPLYYRSVII